LPPTIAATCDSLAVTAYAGPVTSDESEGENGEGAPTANVPTDLLAAEAGPSPADRSLIGGMASSIADGAGTMISAALSPVGSLATGARRRIGERSGARVRRVRRMARHDLPNLWELHPEARRAALRELGIVTVPVESILGTAVEGPAQRGGDFLPLKERRSGDWRGRWQRILRAFDRLESLPPVDLLRFGDGYWVVDGHNRVAAALYTGQVELDAAVQDVRLPGAVSADPPAPIAGVLEGSLDLRAAGSGRRSRTATRREDLNTVQREVDRRSVHEHHDHDPDADLGPPEPVE
jgi:hypothetical protein